MEPLSINCLVSSDGPGKMFTVEIPPNKNVSILKAFIKKKTHPYFSSVDAMDIQLFKLKVSLAPDEACRLSDPLQDDAVQELSSPFDEISDHFHDPAKRHVHVIVLAPTVQPKRPHSLTDDDRTAERSRPFETSDQEQGDNTPRAKRPHAESHRPKEYPEHMKLFKKHLLPAATGDTPNLLEDRPAGDEAGKDEIEVLDLSPLLKLGRVNEILRPYTQTFIRRAYGEFRQYVEDTVQQKKDRYPWYFMLLGHPGIGKTALLLVMLCWCLETKTPVYYQPKAHLIWFFNEDGCECLKQSDFTAHRRDQPLNVAHYYLFDLNASQQVNNVEGVGRTVVIVSSSPSTARYRAWAKLHGDARAFWNWWMEPWTLEELMAWTRFRGGNLAAVQQAFMRFGGSAQLCFGKKSALKSAMRTQDDEIKNIVESQAWIMTPLSESPQTQRDNWSSTVATIFPWQRDGKINRNQAEVLFASSYAGSQIAQKVQKCLIECIFRHSDDLCRSGWSRTAAGSIFEELAHRTLRAGLYNAELRSLSTDPGHEKSQSISTQVFDTGDLQANIKPNTYLRPKSGTFPGIDALVLDQSGRLNLFQITINTSHRVNPRFLKVIPEEHWTQMRLIFVMPVQEGGQMKKQGVEASKEGNFHTIVKGIPQFVLTLTGEQVKAAV